MSVAVGGGAGNAFVQQSVTIAAGQSVTWTNAGGNHNVHFNGEAPLNAASTTNWTATKAFPTPGTFTYVCDIHAPGMSGTVTVTAVATPTPLPGTPTPAPAPVPTTPVVDTVAPKATKVAATGTLRRAVVKLRLDEAATVTARLTRQGQTETLKRVTRSLKAGDREITLSRTLSAGKRYRVSMRIVDATGNVSTKTISFTAKRPS